VDSLQIFDKLRDEQSDFARKLHVVSCDLQKDDLGLDANELDTIHEEVQIFFHCAATLRFNEHLRFQDLFILLWFGANIPRAVYF